MERTMKILPYYKKTADSTPDSPDEMKITVLLYRLILLPQLKVKSAQLRIIFSLYLHQT